MSGSRCWCGGGREALLRYSQQGWRANLSPQRDCPRIEYGQRGPSDSGSREARRAKWKVALSTENFAGPDARDGNLVQAVGGQGALTWPGYVRGCVQTKYTAVLRRRKRSKAE
jgi:hypothetical protein